MRTLLDFDDGTLQYTEAFIDRAESDYLLTSLNEELCWREEEIVLFGRRIKQPRLIVWNAEPGTSYRYSGLSLTPSPWHPDLARLRSRLQEHLQQKFNSVLANAYRNGRDSMGWHADDEPELGQHPVIASLSFGAERRFLLRRKGVSGSSAIQLGHGSLLVMKGDCQQQFQHSVPKTTKPVGLRINLTYRLILGQAPPC